jgi:hypothetical protein
MKSKRTSKFVIDGNGELRPEHFRAVMTTMMKKMLLATATLVALAMPAAADELPAAYLGTWCGNEGALVPDPASKHPVKKVGNEQCGPNDSRTTFKRDRVLFLVDGEPEDCRFVSVRKGQKWPRWTKPEKGDWVPEVDITTKCMDGSTLKYRLHWLKGDQLSIEER